MRKYTLVAVLLLLANGAHASSYLDIFGALIAPIQYTPSAGVGNHPYSGANLQSSATLTFSDLAGAELVNADLFGANLSDSDLSSANLSNANLHFARLNRSVLIDTDLTGATLDSSILHSANLWNANLSGGSLSFAILTAADLSDTTLTNTNLVNSSFWLTNFSGAAVAGADFSNANLENATNLQLTTGFARYNANTNFTNAWSGAVNSTLFNPVAAGWILIPEPSTALLMGFGLAAIAGYRRP